MKAKVIKLLVVVTCAMAFSGCAKKSAEEFHNNYVDMRQVTDFQISEDGNGITLFMNNGEGYYWER